MRFSSRIKLIRLHLEKALWQHDHSTRILITGCGRSGTNYVARALNSIGFPFSHEGFPKKGIAAWPLAVKTHEAMPWWMLFKQGDFIFKPILHQVRHPLSVIASAQTFANSSWSYIKKFIPINDNDSLLLKCMKYWYYWNLKAEEMAEWTYRVESFPELFPEFCERMGHPELIKKKNKFSQMVKSVNSRAGWLEKNPLKLTKKSVTWSRLEEEDKELCELIKLQARKYGYIV
ncbi:MAG TPA: hypothetical protein VJC08_01655 [bacterium]|nr:hypothetical protein [bacterium]